MIVVAGLEPGGFGWGRDASKGEVAGTGPAMTVR